MVAFFVPKSVLSLANILRIQPSVNSNKDSYNLWSNVCRDLKCLEWFSYGDQKCLILI